MSSHCESHARMKSPEDGCPVCLTAKLQEAVGIAQKFAEAARDACIAGLAQSSKMRQYEDRIAELEAELLGAMREKEDVRRTATEAALRHIAKAVMGYKDDYVTDHWVKRHLSAVFGEEKP